MNEDRADAVELVWLSVQIARAHRALWLWGAALVAAPLLVSWLVPANPLPSPDATGSDLVATVVRFSPLRVSPF